MHTLTHTHTSREEGLERELETLRGNEESELDVRMLSLFLALATLSSPSSHLVRDRPSPPA